MKNSIGRPVLDQPYEGAFARQRYNLQENHKARTPVIVQGLEAALDRLELRSGMAVSFHHHLRNGDEVLDLVLRALAARGLKDLTVVASSLFPCHRFLIDCFLDGTVTGLETAYISGPVALAISQGLLARPVRLTTHGGRARAILEGERPIDVAFLAAPAVTADGAVSGAEGPAACGSLGYAVADAWRADQVVALTDNLVAEPLLRPDIAAGCVDVIARLERIGDRAGIVSGTTRITRDPVGLKVARDTALLLEHSGLFREGFSLQTGAGGTSLAVTAFVRERLRELGLKASFGCGGITRPFTEMLQEGLFEELYDVQAFDLEAVHSSRDNPRHKRISASRYANPNEEGHLASRLDFVVLGASEIDLDFNVNVTTGSDGRLLGGSGGHADTAAGARLTVVVSQLVNARVSCLVERVTTVTTPGETVDVLVTDRGIALHPAKQDLARRLAETTDLEIVDMETLLERSRALTGRPQESPRRGRPVAISVYRDGSQLDTILGGA